MTTELPAETSATYAQNELTPAQRAEMFALLNRYFEGVTREQFDRDLREKNWVIQLYREKRLVGFSTLLARETDVDGEPLLAIYSGDTIVAPEAWSTPALARAWIATVNRLRAAVPARRCFWLLLTSGFRTYRFLPVFWREFFPRFDANTPVRERRLLEHLATEQYRDRFDPQSGLVRFANPQRLRGALADVPPGREVDPHIAFFVTRNPNYSRGDELVCLTEISDANLTRAGQRMVAASAS